MVRNLYQCDNAHVLGKVIYCRMGKPLSRNFQHLRIDHLIKGEPLELAICQRCSDFDNLGDTLKDERGWRQI